MIDVEDEEKLWSQIDSQIRSGSRFKAGVKLVERYAHFVFFKSMYRNIGRTEPIRGICAVDPDVVQHSVEASEGHLINIILDCGRVCYFQTRRQRRNADALG
jgi:hypothetical protein